MNHGSLFSDIGLLDYGLHLAGIAAVWGCEVDPWRRAIWQQRFRAPCHPDIRELGAVDVGRVDLIAGGFPCKGASTAGKRNGFDHPETVLWREMFRVVRELRPRYVLVENVANLLAVHDGAVWGEVLGDLASLGFDVEWDCLPAAAVGAPHRRDRVFAVATHPAGLGAGESADVADPVPGGGQAWPVVAGRVRDPAPHADGDGLREQSVSERGGIGAAELAGAGEATANAQGEDGQGARTRRPALGGTACDRGVPVEWGGYEFAIRRWETAHGPAPEPLVRRVDDRGAARVERPRLSALGDGVQVQVGQLVGAYILERDAERMRAAA